MLLKDILQHLDYELIFGDISAEVKGVSCNSSECKENYIFVAIKGVMSDGHDFIADAVSKGAKVIFYEAYRGLDISGFRDKNITFVKVLNPRLCFSKICAVFYGFPSEKINLAGVTGTNGKTSVTYILESVLQNCAVMGTINYRYKDKVYKAENTTPDSCKINSIIKEFAEAGAKTIAMEVSSHGIHMHRADNIDFNVGIFTNLTPEHLDYHNDMDEYFAAKLRFFKEIIPSGAKEKKGAVINIDDKFGKKILSELRNIEKVEVVSYSLKDREAELFYEKFETSLNGTDAILNCFGEKLELKTNLFGGFNLYNILAAIGSLKFLGADIKSSVSMMSKKRIIIPGRLEKVDKNHNIFVDYAHTEDALKNVLLCLNELKNKKSRIITVFGCGGDRDKSKRPLMGETAAKLSDFVVITSDNPRNEEPLDIIEDIVRGVRGNIDENSYRIIPDREDAIKMSIKLAKHGDIVLIAGKGHEDYQIIGDKKFAFSDKRVVADFLKDQYGKS